MKKQRLGAKLDRYDPRDYRFEDLVLRRGITPAVVDRSFYSMVDKSFRLNQGNEGTCVGHAATNVLTAGPSEHLEYLDFETVESAHQFARRLYLESSGDASYQNGMYPRDACATLVRWGMATSYWSVPDVDQVSSCLLTYGPLMVTLPWYMSMYYRNDKLSKAYGNYWVRVKLDSDLVGYHEVALTGVDLAPNNGAPPFFRLENSWGAGWGVNGTARLAVEDFRRLNTSDNWTLAEVPF